VRCSPCSLEALRHPTGGGGCRLYDEQTEVARRLDRAIDAAQRLPLGEVFGSESFHG